MEILKMSLKETKKKPEAVEPAHEETVTAGSASRPAKPKMRKTR
jgi:hypothetical protein